MMGSKRDGTFEGRNEDYRILIRGEIRNIGELTTHELRIALLDAHCDLELTSHHIVKAEERLECMQTNMSLSSKKISRLRDDIKKAEAVTDRHQVSDQTKSSR